MGKKRNSSDKSKIKIKGRNKKQLERKIDHRHHVKKKKHTWKSVREKQRVKLGGSEEPDTTTTSSREDGTVKIRQGSKVSSSFANSSSSLRKRMMDRLSVARFRTLNAAMDAQPPPNLSASTRQVKSSSSNPLSRKETFASYHEGFNTACSLWKQNPLDVISDWIVKSVPKNHVIADFGCGSGKLAKSIPHTTHSFDLHALEDHVVACDMRNVPLSNDSVHVVVFCLSLMGSDVTEFIDEARRVLVNGGLIKIAEASARLNGNESMRRFVGGMKQLGFQRVGPVQHLGGEQDSVFVVMEFKKLPGQFTKRKQKSVVMLNACVYKKR